MQRATIHPIFTKNNEMESVFIAKTSPAVPIRGMLNISNK
jgi:hypothetical protein